MAGFHAFRDLPIFDAHQPALLFNWASRSSGRKKAIAIAQSHPDRSSIQQSGVEFLRRTTLSIERRILLWLPFGLSRNSKKYAFGLTGNLWRKASYNGGVACCQLRNADDQL
jgi:hypothetical protein